MGEQTFIDVLKISLLKEEIMKEVMVLEVQVYGETISRMKTFLLNMIKEELFQWQIEGLIQMDLNSSLL